MGAEIAGISLDSHFCHAAFAAQLKLSYPLLSDFNREVAGRYAGSFPEVAGYRGVNRRRVLVLDRSAVVRWAWTAEVPSDMPDTEMVREAVQEVVYG